MIAGEAIRRVPFIQRMTLVLKDRPFKIQVAVNRQWERAWKIDPEKFTYTKDQIRDFVKGEVRIVAIELFYKTIEGFDFYFGVQCHPTLKGPRDPFEFINTYFLTLLELQDLSFASVVYRLGETLNQNPSTFTLNEPTAVLIGVVDWWLTFGPCEIWKMGEPKRLTLDALKQKLKGHEGLMWNARNYTGLEFVYDVAPKHWVSYQVGEKDHGTFRLNYDRTLHLLSDYLHFAV